MQNANAEQIFMSISVFTIPFAVQVSRELEPRGQGGDWKIAVAFCRVMAALHEPLFPDCFSGQRSSSFFARLSFCWNRIESKSIFTNYKFNFNEASIESNRIEMTSKLNWKFRMRMKWKQLNVSHYPRRSILSLLFDHESDWFALISFWNRDVELQWLQSLSISDAPVRIERNSMRIEHTIEKKRTIEWTTRSNSNRIEYQTFIGEWPTLFYTTHCYGLAPRRAHRLPIFID